MKKVLIVCLFLLISLSFSLSAINTPWLHTEGRFIKDPLGNKVVLRGISMISLYVTANRIGPRTSYYPHPEEPDEEKANLKAVIDLMANEGPSDWNARVIRVAVYPKNIDDDPGWNTISARDRYNELIETAVDYATAKGIYVILDWHYVDDYGDKVDATMAFWDWATPRFKEYSNVLFEIYNEPIDQVYIHEPSLRPYSWDVWKDTLAQPVTDRIRLHHGARNLILVSGPRWSQLIGGANNNPITGGDIVYVSHIYPYHYENIGSTTHPVGDLSPYLGETVNNYPVFFSEWGFQDGGNIPCDAVDEDRYAAGMKQFLNEGGHSWTFWCFDPWWEPVAWGNWQFTDLLGSTLPNTGGYHGAFMKEYLEEEKNNNLPQVSGGTPGPTPTPPPLLAGDVNGSNTIDIVDALMTAQYYVGLNPPGYNTANGDVNCDGTISIVDALIIAQYYVGLLTKIGC